VARDYETQHQAPSAYPPPAYLASVRTLLTAAQGLKQAQPQMAPQAVKKRRRALEARADRLLLRPDRADSLSPSEDKIRRRLCPAGIRRRLGSGNRTPRGAQVFARVASVVATCVQQGRSVVEYLRATMSPVLLHREDIR
jgi:hypothetical protein